MTPPATRVSRQSRMAVMAVIPDSSATSGTSVSTTAVIVDDTRTASPPSLLVSSPSEKAAMERGWALSTCATIAARSRIVMRSLTAVVRKVTRYPATAPVRSITVSYTHLRAHETRHDLVCRLLLEKK